MVVSVRDLVKHYQALRPLRIKSLDLGAGEVKAITGLDAQAAEVLVGLLTGALLPDTGSVSIFGRSTAEVTDSEAWLAMLDRVGILTDRAVLIAQFTVEQNIAMPLTLEVEPIAAAMQPQVDALAAEVGLTGTVLRMRVAEAAGDVVARVRLARALALQPGVLLAEHPSASVPRAAVKAFARDLDRIAKARALAILAMTADDEFAGALGGEVLRHEAATGALKPPSWWDRWRR